MHARFLLWTILSPFLFVSSTLVSQEFRLCKTDGKLNSSTLTSTKTRSLLACVRRCVIADNCAAFTACPDAYAASGAVNCSLQAETVLQGLYCSTAVDAVCVYGEMRAEPPPTCANGGTLNGTHCACPVQYAGSTCERLIRDCSEPFDRGFNKSYNGAYWIQPINTTSPFQVFCALQHGGVTRLLVRRGSSFNKNMTAMQAGFGTVELGGEFFVGLDNLHAVFKQAKYTNNIFIMYNGYTQRENLYYDDFGVGDSSTSFELTYFRSWTDGLTQDGYAGVPAPLLFSAVGDDLNGCAGIRGAAGWYGSDCGGYSVFADPLLWPVDGADVQPDMLAFYTNRKSPYVEG